ncbi:MAG: hypothetical protein AAFV29_19015 [Myxococcota bacterium]
MIRPSARTGRSLDGGEAPEKTTFEWLWSPLPDVVVVISDASVFIFSVTPSIALLGKVSFVSRR